MAEAGDVYVGESPWKSWRRGWGLTGLDSRGARRTRPGAQEGGSGLGSCPGEGATAPGAERGGRSLHEFGRPLWPFGEAVDVGRESSREAAAGLRRGGEAGKEPAARI